MGLGAQLARDNDECYARPSDNREQKVQDKMAQAATLASLGLRRCPGGCGDIKLLVVKLASPALREQARAFGLDPDALDRCLCCEQIAAIRAARDAEIELGEDEFKRMLSLAGRANGPALLLDARRFKVISSATITAAVGPVWEAAEYPQDSLSRADWLDLFTVAGFTIDGRPAVQPTGPTTLWRGCVHALRRRMSWTSDRGLAQRFAIEGFRGRPAGRLYQTVAPPDAVLCVNNGREESEYVINTRGLAVREV
jgi:hypothetical protein